MLRKATSADLPAIQHMVKKVIRIMEVQGLFLWDDVYPNAYFAQDIAQQRLYIYADTQTIYGVFALCEHHEGAKQIQWSNPAAHALYLERFVVNSDLLRQQVGTKLLSLAMNEAQKQADVLRLFVVQTNSAAIHLYEKRGFSKIGSYMEIIDEALSFYEDAYEICL